MKYKPRRNDLTGQVFGKWTVLSFNHINKSRSAYWLCLCTCGAQHVVAALNLRKGESTQCRACSGKEKTSVYKQGNKKKFIYLFKLNEYYKIGVTDNPSNRLSTLNRASPFEITAVSIQPNTPGLEEKLHARYTKSLIKGEWFLLSQAQVEDIVDAMAVEREACVSGACELS